MIHPYLKFIGNDRRFALLKEPAVDLHGNEELYRAVRQHGKAIIIP